MSGAAPAAVRPPGCIVGVFSETEKRLTTSSLHSLSDTCLLDALGHFDFLGHRN